MFHHKLSYLAMIIAALLAPAMAKTNAIHSIGKEAGSALVAISR
ncbi:hypothetical protein [Candidatus Igneacidithiobacillus taiwanensis]|nr:hypothetical protein [Candidatus Igneacidithiobacillus taiwanensis]